MATKLGEITSLDPRYFGEFKEVCDQGNENGIFDYLVNNCPCEHEEIEKDAIFFDDILQENGHFCTYKDLICETVTAYSE